jgi:DNA-binding NarL/FixJ family response regulator
MPRILVADDHSVVRRHVCELLESEKDFVVCGEASNGLEAIQVAEAEHPDFVILDLSMPKMNGLEAARQIHKRFPLIDMIILTMYDPLELMDDVIASGVRTCILKTDLHHLVTMVHSIWQHRQSAGANPATSQSPTTPDSSGADDAVETAADTLTAVERQIVQMLAQAKSNKDIATTLSLTMNAVKVHRAVIMHKLKIKSMFELVHYALQKKLVETKSTVKPFVTTAH